MTHEELLAKIDKWAKGALGVGSITHQQMCYGEKCDCDERDNQGEALVEALRAVVELHKPYLNYRGDECFCTNCGDVGQYPCPTIQAIEKELK